MSRRTTIAVALVAVVAAVGSACTSRGDPPRPSGAAPPPVAAKIAFFQDLSVPAATQVVTPSYLALRLALAGAAEHGALSVVPEVEAMDAEGDPERAIELAREVVADPSFVAAVIAPFWSEPAAVGDILDAAGISTLSLSGLDATLSRRGWSNWRRLVPGIGRQALSMATALRGVAEPRSGLCLAGDGSPYAASVTRLLTMDLGAASVDATTTVVEESSAADAVAHMAAAGCGVVGWTGFADGATWLRTTMSTDGMGRVPFLGMDAMKTDSYLTSTAGNGEGTVVTCGCVDLATSAAPEAGRFIHDFQSEYGSPPGVYAAEAWDAGGMLVAAFAAGEADRGGVARQLSLLDPYHGLVTTYLFTPDRELDPASTEVRLFRGEGVRWVPVGGVGARADLPLVTPGYLSMSACRDGRPFAYSERSRPRGFDVELGGLIARRLGLSLSWTGLPCRAAIDAVTAGTLDAVFAPVSGVVQGTPTSRIALSLHAALVTTTEAAAGAGRILDQLGEGDVVAVVGDRQTRVWARASIPVTGAALLGVKDPAVAYRGVTNGRYTAVVDQEPHAWASVERRPDLAVAQSVDIGGHDVIVAKGPDAILVAAIDEVLGRLIRDGRYALLFAKYFPGVPVPRETGS